MDASIGTIWEAVAAHLPGRGRDLGARPRPHLRRVRRPRRPPGRRPRRGRRRPGRHGGLLPLQRRRVPGDGVRRLQDRRVPVNANYRYTGHELTELLADADAAAVVFSGTLAGNVTHAAEHVRTLRCWCGSAPVTARRRGTSTSCSPPHPRDPPTPRPGSDQLFMYTGGTTGKPKGVIWRQADLLHSLTVPIFRPLGTGLPATLDEAVEVAVAAHATGRAADDHAGRSPDARHRPVQHDGRPARRRQGGHRAAGRARPPACLGDRRGTAGRHDHRRRQRRCQPLVDELRAAEEAGTPHDLSSLRAVDQLRHRVQRPAQEGPCTSAPR